MPEIFTKIEMIASLAKVAASEDEKSYALGIARALHRDDKASQQAFRKDISRLLLMVGSDGCSSEKAVDGITALLRRLGDLNTLEDINVEVVASALGSISQQALSITQKTRLLVAMCMASREVVSLQEALVHSIDGLLSSQDSCPDSASVITNTLNAIVERDSAEAINNAYDLGCDLVCWMARLESQDARQAFCVDLLKAYCHQYSTYSRKDIRQDRLLRFNMWLLPVLSSMLGYTELQGVFALSEYALKDPSSSEQDEAYAKYGSLYNLYCKVSVDLLNIHEWYAYAFLADLDALHLCNQVLQDSLLGMMGSIEHSQDDLHKVMAIEGSQDALVGVPDLLQGYMISWVQSNVFDCSGETDVLPTELFGSRKHALSAASSWVKSMYAAADHGDSGCSLYQVDAWLLCNIKACSVFYTLCGDRCFDAYQRAGLNLRVLEEVHAPILKLLEMMVPEGLIQCVANPQNGWYVYLQAFVSRSDGGDIQQLLKLVPLFVVCIVMAGSSGREEASLSDKVSMTPDDLFAKLGERVLSLLFSESFVKQWLQGRSLAQCISQLQDVSVLFNVGMSSLSLQSKGASELYRMWLAYDLFGGIDGSELSGLPFARRCEATEKMKATDVYQRNEAVHQALSAQGKKIDGMINYKEKMIFSVAKDSASYRLEDSGSPYALLWGYLKNLDDAILAYLPRGASAGAESQSVPVVAGTTGQRITALEASGAGIASDIESIRKRLVAINRRCDGLGLLQCVNKIKAKIDEMKRNVAKASQGYEDIRCLENDVNKALVKKISGLLNAIYKGCYDIQLRDTDAGSRVLEFAEHARSAIALLQQPAEFSHVGSIGSRFRVVQWDKGDVGTFSLGEDVGCCLAQGSSQFGAMVYRRSDDACLFHVVVDEQREKPAAFIWLYLAEDSGGKVVLVANFFEVHARYGTDEALRKTLLNHLLLFTHNYCESNGLEFYMMPLRYGFNAPDLDAYPKVKMELKRKVGAFLSEYSWRCGDDYYLGSLDAKEFHLFDPAILEAEMADRSVAQESAPGVALVSP